jgi:hypothetical protein
MLREVERALGMVLEINSERDEIRSFGGWQDESSWRHPLGDGPISRRPKPPKTPGNHRQPPQPAFYESPCNQGKSS